MDMCDVETRCKPLKKTCLVHVVAAKPKRGGKALKRWDGANIHNLVGRTVSVEELEGRGLTEADIQYELTTPTRKGFQLVCSKPWGR